MARIRRLWGSAKGYWYYWVLIPGIIASYVFCYIFMPNPEPWQIAIKSNLTVMLVVTFGLAGLLNSRVWRLIEAKKPKFQKTWLLGWRRGTWCSIVSLAVVLTLLINIYLASGYELRW